MTTLTSFTSTLRTSLKRYVTPEAKGTAYNVFRRATSTHRPNGLPNVFLFTMPRSGSTWLMELIWSQPGFKCVNEPLDLRNPLVRNALDISDWEELHALPPEALAKLHSYFEGYCEGRVHAAEPAPFRNRFYRPLTERIVFKVIHGGEDKINWFRDSFHGRVAYFIRHPIAVSLSHEVFPRLGAFLGSSKRHFSGTQLRYAKRIAERGSKLEQGVLDWCFQNAVPLRNATSDWAILSYEQFVLNPESAVNYLAEKLELPDRGLMMTQLARASGVVKKSDEETQRILKGEAEGRERLVSKWRKKVSEEEERRAMDILELFEIDAYRFGELLPTERLWVQESYDPARNLHREIERLPGQMYGERAHRGFRRAPQRGEGARPPLVSRF
jgi:hypothetical protein